MGAKIHAEEFKASGLTPSQYNVLRILRGARPDAVTCGEIGERMVTRDPDLTRLLDQLEAAGMVTKSRDADDRRVVKAFGRSPLDYLGVDGWNGVLLSIEFSKHPG